MQAADIFFQLCARDKGNNARSAFRLSPNDRWLREATSTVAGTPLITSRESTPALEPGSQNEGTTWEETLVVTFPELLKHVEDGIHFGTDPRICQILLGHRGTPGISRQQCTLFVDESLRLWLRDTSSYGTAVECNNQHRIEVRRKHDWILTQKPGTRLLFEDITVHAGQLAFGVVFPNHESPSMAYLENLRKLMKICGRAAAQATNETSAFTKLALWSNTTTAAPSSLATPTDKNIYYDCGNIGRGAFGEVRKIIEARSGRFFASKKFYPPNKKRQRGERNPAWLVQVRREFNLLARHPHPNVVQVFEFRETPEPVMIMAYYPMGMDETLYMSAFAQVLCGLDHLHRNGVAHRDLKPQNLLYETEPLFKVVIADFGLANTVPDTTLLKTFCGSPLYVAPEVFPSLSNGHGCLVDIWSLGIIVFEWIYGSVHQPTQNPRDMKRWCEEWCGCLLVKLDQEDDCALTRLLHHMIEPIARDRWSAKQCLDYGLQDNCLFRSRDQDGLIVCVDELSDATTADVVKKNAKASRDSLATIVQRSSRTSDSFQSRKEQKLSKRSRVHTVVQQEPRQTSHSGTTPIINVGDRLQAAMAGPILPGCLSKSSCTTWSAVSAGKGVTFPSELRELSQITNRSDCW